MSIFNKKSNIIVMPSFGFTLDILKEALILNKNKNIYVFEEFSSEVFPYNHGVKTLNVEEFRKMLLEKDSRIALTLEERLFDIYGLPPHVDFMQNRRYVLDINGLKHKFPPFDENTRILRDIQRLKDKSHFRDWISQVYDDIWYETVSLNELSNMEYPGRPCVIQVAVGFGSKGIAIVKNESEWDKAKDNAIISAKKGENIFGKTVVNSDKWVVVEYFTGEEYAVDGFITDKGKPVITGIYQHVFKDANDTSDRVYLTSKSIMESYLDKVLDSIKPILKAKEAKSLFGTLFHLEFKDDKENGKHIFPIEWNIFRLGGYGLNKLTKFAFDINPYDYYFKQKEVNWKKILKKSDGKIHYFVLV